MMHFGWLAVMIAMAAPPDVHQQQLAAAVYDSNLTLTPQGKIDRYVFSQLRKSNIDPARVCSDAVFVRRVYLDVIGMLFHLAVVCNIF